MLTLPTLISFVTGPICGTPSCKVSVNVDTSSEFDVNCSKYNTPFDVLSLASETTIETNHRASHLLSSTQSLSLKCKSDEESEKSYSPRDVLRHRHHLQHSLMISSGSSFPETTSFRESLSGPFSDDEMSTISIPSSPISEDRYSTELPIKMGNTNVTLNHSDNSCFKVESPRVISWLLFSHLNFCFPEKQQFPHRSTNEEIDYLNQFCCQDKIDEQCIDVLSLSTTENREFFVYAYNSELRKSEVIQCLSSTPLIISELMMLGLNEACVEDFAGNGIGYNPIPETTKNAAIQKIIKPSDNSNNCDSVLDQFWFNPCGYSCNALMKEKNQSIDSNLMAKPFGPHFVTVHISPEPDSSYASLEVTFPINLGKSLNEKNGNGKSSLFELCPIQSLTTFNPQRLHIVEIELCGGQLGSSFIGGINQLNSTTAIYDLLEIKEFRGKWNHIRHAEYSRR